MLNDSEELRGATSRRISEQRVFIVIENFVLIFKKFLFIFSIYGLVLLRRMAKYDFIIFDKWLFFYS